MARHDASYRTRFLHRIAAVALAFCPVFALAADWIYTARPGDNLWNLSAEYLEWGSTYTERLRQHNGIVDPLHIPPGTPIRFPVEWLKVQPASASVLEVQGTGFVLPKGMAQPRALTTGVQLHIGDRLETEIGASATIRFADGSQLIVYEQTRIVMDSLSAYGRTGMVDTRVRLRGGRVETAAEPAQGPASRFEIITPAAIAAVRGTNFRVGASEQDRQVTRTEVVGGVVAVDAAGATEKVAAGFGTLTEEGSPPEPPRPLLPAPDTARLTAVKESLLLAFHWPSVPGVSAYRAQLFQTTKLERLLLDKRVSQPSVEWDAPVDGSYVLRLRAVDEVGLEGFDATHEFTLNARPAAPSLLAPADASAMHGAAPEFWWSVPEGVVSFRLQMARDEQFNDLVLDEHAVTGSRFTVESEPAPATYYWRVSSRDGDDEVGPFSEPQRFRVQAVPENVEVEAPAVDDTELRFTWTRAANAARYDFELAEDKSFDRPLVMESVNENTYRMDKPKGGTYYFRARGVSDEGVAGQFSPVNQVDVLGESDYRPIILLLPLLLLL